MRQLLIVLLFFIGACNDGNITWDEARQLDTLTKSDFNRILRKENDLALEGINLMKTANEDTAAMRRLLRVNDEIDNWRELVKEKLPKNIESSPEQQKMFERVLEFKDQFARFR